MVGEIAALQGAGDVTQGGGLAGADFAGDDGDGTELKGILKALGKGPEIGDGNRSLIGTSWGNGSCWKPKACLRSIMPVTPGTVGRRAGGGGRRRAGRQLHQTRSRAR